MLEIYEIVGKNDECQGYLEYNDKTDTFHAYLKDGASGSPHALFGIFTKNDEADDLRVRDYMGDCVVPKTRENIDDILKHLNMYEYNQWEIFKINKGKNLNNDSQIRLLKVIDSDVFVNPNKTDVLLQ